jgi:hypothetical protein
MARNRPRLRFGPVRQRDSSRDEIGQAFPDSSQCDTYPPARKARTAPKISGATFSRSPSRSRRTGTRSLSSGFKPVSLDYGRGIGRLQRSDNTEGEPQPLFGALVWLRAVHPAIKRAHILDTGDIRRQLLSDNTGQRANQFRKRCRCGFPISGQIRASVGGGFSRRIVADRHDEGGHLRAGGRTVPLKAGASKPIACYRRMRLPTQTPAFWSKTRDETVRQCRRKGRFLSHGGRRGMLREIEGNLETGEQSPIADMHDRLLEAQRFRIIQHHR